MSNYQLFYYKLRHKDKCPICEEDLNFEMRAYSVPEVYSCPNNHYSLTVNLDSIKDELEESIYFHTANYSIYCNLEYQELTFNAIPVANFNAMPFSKEMIKIPAFRFDWKNLPAMEEKIKLYILFS